MNKNKQIEDFFSDKAFLRELFPLSEPGRNEDKCLTDTEVASILDKLMPRQKLDSAISHMISCDSCLELMLLTNRALHPETDGYLESFSSLLESYFDGLRRYVVVVKNSVENMNRAILAPGFRVIPHQGFSSVRNNIPNKETSQTILEKEADPYLFRLELERLSSEKNQLEIIAKNKLTGRSAANLRITLMKNGIETDSYVTQAGRVLFEDMEQGRYGILVSKQGERVCEFDLSLV